MATTVGTIQLIATIDTSQYKKGANEIDKANANIEDSADKTSKKSNSAFLSVAKVGLGAVAAAAVAVGASIVSNFDNAVKRVDTLNNSARTFENLGFGAEQIDNAMKALDKSIRGLPTPLDEAVRGVQMLAGSTNDIGRSQKIFSALNNAVIGFGGTAADVSGAINQLSQAFAGGRIDAQTWNSLIQNNLGPALGALGKTMGLTTKELKEGLSDGTISVEQFQDALIKMNTEGGAGMKSFEKIAKDATSGIGTGWQNMQTAITRGIARVIEAIGSENISAFITNIGTAFENGSKSIVAFFGFVRNNIDTIKQISTVITILLIPAIIRLGYAMTLAGVQALVAGGRMALAWLLALGPIGLIIAAVAAAAYLITTNLESIRNFAVGVWEAIVGAVKSAISWISTNWPLLLGIIAGPIGFAAASIIKSFERVRQVIGNVFNWIKGVYGTIGEIGASVIRGAVNAVLGYAERTINGFIRIINGALNAINRLPGVNIGRIGEVRIPKLAEGGIITSPTLAMVGEGREAEAVIPLSKLDDMMSNNSRPSGNGEITINIDMSGIMTDSKAGLRNVANQIVEAVNEQMRAKSLPQLGVNT